MKPPRTYVKAITAGGAAAAYAAGIAMADGDITRPEIVIAAGAGLVAGAAVYASPKNADA